MKQMMVNANKKLRIGAQSAPTVLVPPKSISRLRPQTQTEPLGLLSNALYSCADSGSDCPPPPAGATTPTLAKKSVSPEGTIITLPSPGLWARSST
jgi:hypothetical protein